MRPRRPLPVNKRFSRLIPAARNAAVPLSVRRHFLSPQPLGARRWRRASLALLLVCGSGIALAALPATVNLEFSIADLVFSENLQFRGLKLRCDTIEISAAAVDCQRATLTAAHSPLGAISLNAAVSWRGREHYRLSARGRIGDSSPIELVVDAKPGGRHMELKGDEVALPTVSALLSELPFFSDHTLDSGTLTFAATCRDGMSSVPDCTLEGRVDALNMNGSNVAETLDARFTAAFSTAAAGTTLGFDLVLERGAIYVEPGFTMGGIKPGFFVNSNYAPIALAARLTGLGSDQIRINHVHLTHPEVVELNFTGDLYFAPEPRWETLEFSFATDKMVNLYRTYLQPLSLDTALSSLDTAGGLHARLAGSNNEIDELNVRFDELYIDDQRGRFSLYGLDGEIDLHAGGTPRESHIGWIGGALYKVPIGAGRIDWTSARRNLQVASWQDVELFDGVLRLDTLEVRNFSLDGTEIALSGTLTPITLSTLTAAFGWMPLAGKLSGNIPLLTYSANRLSLDGALTVNLFDGQVAIRDLEIDKLFSTVPVLSATVVVDQISLEELTRTFSFGSISGRLDGRIDDLMLQAWQPIRFDAEFATPPDDPTPHRISQQAVDNLGRLGAGTGSGLSQGWLRFIPSYSYGRLGIGCELLNGHCLMRGVASDPDGGFFILTRGGIFPPWIDVKGSGRRIRWQTLVDGIKQISQGNVELDIGGAGTRKTH